MKYELWRYMMPKTPKNKKKRAKVDLEQRKKKAKRLKFDDELPGDEERQQVTEVEVAGKSEGNVSEHSDDDDSDSNKGEGHMLEKMLEEHAVKNNLSAINVKSILHHVITDRRVLELVQKVIAEKERENSKDDIDFEYEPKMTRSKFRQKNLDDPISQLTISPIKKPVSTFTDLEFPESSSDEEYEPNEEEEDEDTESCVSAQSDLASPFKPATPDVAQADSTQEIIYAETFSPSVSRPLTRHRSQDKIFKKPSDTITAVNTETPLDQNDLIAKRTRSLLPLKDIDLPYDIELPDFSPDLYDQVKLDDLDEDQIAFQKFLQSIANGDDEDLGEDDDYEYDFMAESTDAVEEKEEYRNDRAVRIPKKEVSDLFAELLSESNTNEDESVLWSTRFIALEDDDKDEVIFTAEQRTQLSKQMNQHVQLLAQVYLLSREEPSLQEEAETCRQFVNELQGFCDRSLSVHPIMALGGNMPAVSMFDVPGIQDAVRIVNEPFNQVKRPRSPRKQPSTPTKESKSKVSRAASQVTPVSLANQALMANSPLFKDLILLPRCGFMDKEVLGKKESSTLRIKFTETEDNLLAIGMNQFQRNWKLIQAHLLPVKSPKQLQIRCKNLYSSRSSSNIVKHLRDTKTLWKLPTEIRINSDSDNKSRHNRVAPDWLINYRQKIKPQKKMLPPSPRKSTIDKLLLSNSQPTSTNSISIRTTTTNRLATNNTLTNQTIVSTATNNRLSTSSPTNQLSVINAKSSGQLPLSNMQSNTELSSRGTLQQKMPLVEDKAGNRVADAKKDVKKDLSESTQPGSSGVRVEQSEVLSSREQSQPVDTSCKQTLDNNKLCPNEATNHGDNDADNQPSPDCNTCDDVPDHMTDDTGPITPVTQHDKDETHLGSSPGQSDNVQESKALKSSPVSTSAKSKTLRDKVSSVTPHLCSNTKKTLIQNLPPLPPDPKEPMRAQALADNYLSKVKNCLQDNQEHYEEFLATLVESSAQQWTPVQIYKRMETVLADYPELIEDFVAFLEPEQALEAGVLMENLEFIRARTFLHRLEVHFHKHRSHFQKIIEVFSKWGEGEKSPLELHEKVIPLLRGQQHLVEEFQTFFDHLKPPACCEEDFEEVEIGSGSEQEVDDFEEVVIPKHQGKIKPKQPPNPSTKNTTSKQKPSGTSKQTQNSPWYRTTKHDRRRQASKKSPQVLDGTSRDGVSEGEDDGRGKKLTGVSPSSHRRQRKILDDELEQGPSSVTTDWSASDGPPSVTSTFLNDTSNDSVKHDEHSYTPRDRWMTASNDAIDDADDIDGNDDDGEDDVGDDDIVDDDGGEDDIVDDDGGEDVGDFDDNDAEDEEEESDNNYEDNESAYDDTCDNTEDGSEFIQGTLSAQNHHLDQDGKLVVLWTRDDDRSILSVCHNQGATIETFHQLAAKMNGKTAQEIKKRFEELMKLYEAGNSKEQSSSDDDEVDSDDEDDDS